MSRRHAGLGGGSPGAGAWWRLPAAGPSVPAWQASKLVAAGQRIKENAAALDISEETVRVYMKNVLTKLNVSDRTAARTWRCRGIVHVD